MSFKVNFWMKHLSNPQMQFGNITITAIFLPTVRHDEEPTVGMLCGLLTKYTFKMRPCLSEWKTVIEHPSPNLWANRKPNVCLETFQLSSRIKSRKMIIYTSNGHKCIQVRIQRREQSKLKIVRLTQRQKGDRSRAAPPWLSHQQIAAQSSGLTAEAPAPGGGEQNEGGPGPGLSPPRGLGQARAHRGLPFTYGLQRSRLTHPIATLFQKKHPSIGPGAKHSQRKDREKDWNSSGKCEEFQPV